MNNLDARYQALLEDILHWGVEKTDRTGTGTISVFGRQIRHKMSEGFPLLTTKKMAWKTMVTELLWFLRGDTNIKFLLDYDCHIWDGDAYKRYKSTNPDNLRNYEMFETVDELTKTYTYFTQEEFINKIKTNDEFAKKWGELGPIYGKQWRSWNGKPEQITNYKGGEINPYFCDCQEGFEDGHSKVRKKNKGVDQIANLINELKTNPDSRRLMVNAWNVGELDQMVLPPCHYGFQVYTRELSNEERYSMVSRITDKMTPTDIEKKQWIVVDNIPHKIPTRAISLMYNTRSQDVPLGTPFNIASYALLLMMIAKQVNMVPDELITNMGDCHIYLNQIDGVKEQLTRTPYELPTVELLGDVDDIANYEINDIILKGYQSHPSIKMPLSN
jgi:thymidylate synthase